MATKNQIRMVGLELQENVTALKAAVDAIDAVTSAWVLNDIDGSLPTALGVQAELTAYNELTVPGVSLSDAITAIQSAV